MKLVVLGGGESGVGSAVLGLKMKWNVFLSDSGEIAEVYKKVLLHNNITFEEKKHTESEIFQADLVVKSPGIPDTVPLLKEIRARGIDVVSEIEFAYKYTKANLVGITGSNGKTTTTMLTYHILKNSGMSVGVAGNIGDSFALQVAENDFEDYVLELSSFQLDGVSQFAPHIAVITNITPDHLDRYNYKIEDYVAAKFRITMNQNADDYLIYDGDDELINEWLSKNKVKAKLLPFSLSHKYENGAYIEEENIIININNEQFKMGITSLALQGKHNLKNSMASAMTAELLKVRKQTIRESLEDFEGAEHRLEKVLKINGVEYINDSKATNINATYYALDSMTTPTVWIVGGVDKGNDYFQLMSMVREKVKAIICLGVDNRKIKEAFNDVVDIIVETQGAEEAVKVAYRLSDKGDSVLLSPACASFDLFKDYEDRGRQFKNAVRHL